MRSGREKAWKWAALLLAAGAAAAGGWAWAMQGELTTARYEVPLPVGLEGLDGVKIAQISDVHSADLEGPLRAALEEAAPDLIVMTGDLVNREDRDLSRALSLARMAAETAPAFFAPGNHEVDNPCWPELRDGLEEAGVQVLEDRAVLWSLRGEAVNLMGLWDVTHEPMGRAHAQAALPERIQALCREGALNVLLSHRPSLLETYGACGADLVFSGHAHGGQVRLPVLGAVFAPDQGLWPQVTAGVHTAGQTQVVVSRGLGNGTPFPRLWNGPELVAVTLRAQESLSQNG